MEEGKEASPAEEEGRAWVEAMAARAAGRVWTTPVAVL
jgi:hypothetical protein